MRLKVYLSGPMTGYPELNYPAFIATAGALRAGGMTVYSPAEWESRYNDGVFNLNIAFADYCTFIAREADGVVVLAGWEKSPGARAEVALALALRKPVFAYYGPDEMLHEIDVEVQMKAGAA